MPFLVDSGPPVDAKTLEAARAELPREYGVRIVDHGGRRVLLARVPRAKPDYNYELAHVAFYVSLDETRDVKDVVLVGDQTSVRMDPIRLRDHVREQMREDQEVLPQLRHKVDRQHGWTLHVSPTNHHNRALVLRLPVTSVTRADESTLLRARAALADKLLETLRQVQFVYLVADDDFGRVGRRVFVDEVCADLAGALAPVEGEGANPLHKAYQTPGHFITDALPRL